MPVMLNPLKSLVLHENKLSCLNLSSCESEMPTITYPFFPGALFAIAVSVFTTLLKPLGL
ncbi:hypothetical protein D3C72_1886280 [compost metagenome]